jgi:subtilisin family serine protease
MNKIKKPITAGLIVAALSLVAAGSANAANREGGEYVPEQVVCGTIVPSYIDSINAQYGTTVISYQPQLGCYLLQTPPGLNADSLATIISTSPLVLYSTPNYYTDAPEPVQGSQPFIDAVPSTEKYTGQTAGTQLQLASTQAISTGANVRVGVIDVGVSLSHPALGNTTMTGFDYIDGGPANDPAGGAASGHGTFVAGIIHLVAPQAQIVSYRVMDTSGRGTGFTVAEAILQAVADSCKVINLSMVMTGKNGSADAAIEYAKNNNVMVVAAAGNDSTNVERFPGSDSYVLGVAAVDSALRKTSFSNYNGKVDLCAPGKDIYAPFLDSSYAYWNGTSFSTPFVAGIAAVILSRRPAMQWSELFNSMTKTAINIDTLNPSFAGHLGDGMVNPTAALEQLGIICGDIDQDAVGPDVADLTRLIDYLYISLTPLPLPGLADVDGQMGIDISDLSRLIDRLFINFAPLQCNH